MHNSTIEREHDRVAHRFEGEHGQNNVELEGAQGQNNVDVQGEPHNPHPLVKELNGSLPHVTTNQTEKFHDVSNNVSNAGEGSKGMKYSKRHIWILILYIH